MVVLLVSANEYHQSHLTLENRRSWYPNSQRLFHVFRIARPTPYGYPVRCFRASVTSHCTISPLFLTVNSWVIFLRNIEMHWNLAVICGNSAGFSSSWCGSLIRYSTSAFCKLRTQQCIIDVSLWANVRMINLATWKGTEIMNYCNRSTRGGWFVYLFWKLNRQLRVA